jgi:tripartite-type tricarboxylate transporter receptor subunit TctC
MSPALVERLNREVNELTKSKEYAEVLKADGNQAVALTPAELSTRVRDTYATWKKLAVAKNIVVD